MWRQRSNLESSRSSDKEIGYFFFLSFFLSRTVALDIGEEEQEEESCQVITKTMQCTGQHHRKVSCFPHSMFYCLAEERVGERCDAGRGGGL